MLRSLKGIKGYRIRALDGDIGKVDDFLFDDVGWFVRYVVAGTGNWLARRKVLVGPEVFETADWPEHTVPVRLTKQLVESSPDLDEDAPVSRHEEERLRTFYGWTSWWHAPMQGVTPVPSREVLEPQAREAAVATGEHDPHLRSVSEVMGYGMEARDGEIGRVDDFIVDDRSWALRYFVAETRSLLPGRKVLLAPQWITEVRWPDGRVVVDLTRRQIKEAPEFDATAPINRRYEERMYDFYGRPSYW